MIGVAARQRLIRVAMGDEPASLILRGGRLVNVVTRELLEADVVVSGERIAALAAPGDYLISVDTDVIDLDGRCVAPGLVDAHIHIESSNLTMSELARAIVPRGVLSLCEDPHEIANVLGLPGIQLLFDEAGGLPLNLFLRVPGRVPAMPPSLETSGHALETADIAALLARPDAVCLGGDINPALLLAGDEATLERIETAVALGRTVGGQLPGFVGPVLDGCVVAGLEDTHVAESANEVVEQLRRGLRVLLTPRIDRLPAEEWPEIAAAVQGLDTRYLVLCTDDTHPNRLATAGHLDQYVRLAVEAGFDPVQAIQMATLNPAELMRLDRDLGAVAPGKLADLVVLDELVPFTPSLVLHHGRVAARDGALAAEPAPFDYPAETRATINLPGPVRAADLALPVAGSDRATVAVVRFGGPKTMDAAEVAVVDGVAQPDCDQDVLPIAVLERHRATGAIGRGFVGGLGITGGAVACSVNHDSHNIFVVGDSYADMAVAANAVADAGGGYCAVVGGAVRALVPLPIAGLLSDRPLAEVAAGVETVERVLLEELSCSIRHQPLYALNFLCLPNIPDVGVTDQGIIETDAMAIVEPVAGVG